jgi:hypothetical protein
MGKRAVSRNAKALRARLELTAVRDRDLDRDFTTEWLTVDQEIWLPLEEPKPGCMPVNGRHEKPSARPK